MRMICALVSIAVLMCVAATKGTPKDESAIRQVLADTTAAFNQHKANLNPESTADDFDVVSPDGAHTSGKPDFARCIQWRLSECQDGS